MDLNERKSILNCSLKQDGYCIVENILSDEECNRYIAYYKSWAKAFPKGCCFQSKMSLVKNYSIGHSEGAWAARLAAKQVFVDIWNTEKLLTSIDAVAIYPPPLKQAQFYEGKSWLHCDQRATRQGLHCYQGAVYLEAAGEDDFCLRVLTRSHNCHQSFFNTFPSARRKSVEKEFYKLNSEQVDLNTTQENEEKLKEAHRAEIMEVGEYIEHLKSLSDERDSLMEKLEMENDHLKSDLEHVHADVSEHGQEEIEEMLSQIDLGEQSGATPVAQVAFLLSERSLLLEQIENDRKIYQNHSPSSNAASREDIIAAMGQDERAQMDKQQEHEEEVSTVMEENEKLEEELHHAKLLVDKQATEIGELKQALAVKTVAQHDQLRLKGDLYNAEDQKEILLNDVCALEKEKAELQKVKIGLEKEIALTKDHADRKHVLRSSNDMALRRIIEEKTKIEGDMIQMRSNIRQCNKEREAAEDQVKNVENESGKFQVTIQQLQMKNKNLRLKVEDIESQLDEAEISVNESNKGEGQAMNKCEQLQVELKSLQDISDKCVTLQETNDVLDVEKLELSSTLDNVTSTLHKVLQEKQDLLAEKDLLDQQRLQTANELLALKDTLEHVTEERTELLSEKDCLITSKTGLDFVALSLRRELRSVGEASEELRSSLRGEELKAIGLQNELAACQAELSALQQTSRDLATRDVTVVHLRERNTAVSKQLTELQSQLEWSRETERCLINNQQASQKAHVESDKRLTAEIDDLRTKLRMALTELQTLKMAYDDQVTDNSSLSNRLSALTSQLSDCMQEIQEKREHEHRISSLLNDLEEKNRVVASFKEEHIRLLTVEEELLNLKEDYKCNFSELSDLLEVEKRVRSEQEFKVKELEVLLEDTESDVEVTQQGMRSKINALEARNNTLQDDLVSTQDSVACLQMKYDDALCDANHAKIEMQKYSEQVLEHAFHVSNTKVLESDLEKSNDQQKQYLNELSTASTRINQLMEQLTNEETAHTKTISSMNTSVCQAQLESNRNTDLENAFDSLRSELSNSQSTTTLIRSELREKENLLDAAHKDIRSLEHRLHCVQVALDADKEEFQRLESQLAISEASIRKFKHDNRDLSRELSDSINCQEQLSQKLNNEKGRNTDACHLNARYVEQMEADLASTNRRVHSLRDELQQCQTIILKLEARCSSHESKNRVFDARSGCDVKVIGMIEGCGAVGVEEKLATALAECKEAKREEKARYETMKQTNAEVSKLRIANDRISIQVELQRKLRNDAENRCTDLEKEMSNMWSKVRQLTELNAEVEYSKKSAQQQLDTLRSKMQENAFLSSRDSVNENCIKQWKSRAEAAEYCAKQLEENLRIKASEGESFQKLLQLSEREKLELKEKFEKCVSMTSQEDKLQKTSFQNTISGLRKEVVILQHHESLVTTENQNLLNRLRRLEILLSQSQSPDSGQHNLMDGITGLSKEVEDVTFFQRKLFASNHSRVNDDSNGDDDIDLYPSVNMNSRRPPTPALLRKSNQGNVLLPSISDFQFQLNQLTDRNRLLQNRVKTLLTRKQSFNNLMTECKHNYDNDSGCHPMHTSSSHDVT